MISLKSAPSMAITTSNCSPTTGCLSQSNISASRSVPTSSNSFQTVSTDTDITLLYLLFDDNENYADYYCKTPAFCSVPARKERKRTYLSPSSYALVKINNNQSAAKAKVALRER